MYINEPWGVWGEGGRRGGSDDYYTAAAMCSSPPALTWPLLFPVSVTRSHPWSRNTTWKSSEINNSEVFITCHSE